MDVSLLYTFPRSTIDPFLIGDLGEIVPRLEKFLIPTAIVLAALPASWQLLYIGYLDGHDSVLHLLRMVEFDGALRAGDLFPRWSPDYALGYGYPLFNYYPPLAYYLAEAVHLLGLGFVSALKAIVVASLVVSGLGMYLFARDLLGSRSAALLSAVAFIYFPYHLSDIYVRGAIPEATFIALVPLSLWAFHHLAVSPAPKYLIAGAFLLAGLILTHVVFLFFLPILAAYCLLLVLFRPASRSSQLRAPNKTVAWGLVPHREDGGQAPTLRESDVLIGVLNDPVSGEERGRSVARPPRGYQGAWSRHVKRPLLFAAGALGLGLALAAFYWLPVLAERNLVAIGTADWITENSISDELLAGDDMVQWSPAYDYQAEFPPKLAGLDLLFAALGLASWLIRKNRRDLLPSLGVFLAILPILVFLLGEASLAFWRQVPLVGLIQFPWRLLVFVGLSTSILTGLLARAGRLSIPVACLMGLAIVYGSTQELKLNYIDYQDNSLSLATLAQYEYESGVMGTAYANEWLPSTARPGFTSPVYEPLGPSPREDVEVATITGFRRRGPLSYTATVSTERDTRVRFHSFFFPGWQARLDGDAVAAYPSTDLGLLTIDIPAGQHEVSVFFGDTPVRALGRLISLAALASLSLVCLATRGRVGRTEGTRPSMRCRSLPHVRHSEAAAEESGGIRAEGREVNCSRTLHGCAQACLGSKGGVPHLPARRREDCGYVSFARRVRNTGRTAIVIFPLLLAGAILVWPSLPGFSTPVMKSETVDFAGRLRLLGLEVANRSVYPDGRIEVTLYWQAEQVGADDLDMTLEAFDGLGNWLGGQAGAPIYSTAQTSTWSENEVVRDHREIRVSRPVAPGPISLRLTVWSGGYSLGSTEVEVD